MNFEKKSKLNVGAGIIFLILAIYTACLLIFNYIVPGYDITFAFVLSAIQCLTYVSLAIAFFAGKVTHAFDVLFSLMAIIELTNLIYLIAVGLRLGALDIISYIVVIISFIIAAAVSASAANNFSGRITGAMKAWPVPGILTILIGIISFAVSIGDVIDYLDYYSDYLNFFDKFTTVFSLISIIIMGVGLLIGLRWIVKPSTKTAPAYGPQQGYAPQGYAPKQGYAPQGYAPNQGYAPQQGYAPNQGYAPPQGFAPPQGYAPNQGYAPQGYAPAPEPAPAPAPEPAPAPAPEAAPRTPIGYDGMTGAPIYADDDTNNGQA